MDKRVVKIPNNKMVDGYAKLKEILLAQGNIEDAKDLTAYTLASSLEEACAAYPAIIAEKVAFVLIKECPLDDARVVSFGIRKRKMIALYEAIKKMHNGEKIDLIKAIEDFNE